MNNQPRKPQLAALTAHAQAIPELPAMIDMDGDLLGLVRHERPREAMAGRIFSGFEAAAETHLRHNLAARDRYLETGRAELPPLEVDLNSFSVTRIHDEEEGRTIYEVFRTDIGSTDGGFSLVLCDNDCKVILRAIDGTVPDTTSPEYLKQLNIAVAFLGMYAEHNRFVAVKEAMSHNSIVRLEEKVRPELLAAQRQESSLRARARRLAGVALQQVQKLYTEPIKSSSGLVERPVPRKLSPVRIGALALIVPLPFVSEALNDSVPVPRPVSYEIVEGATGVVVDMLPGGETEASEYDAEELNLPNASYLTFNEETPVFVANEEVAATVLDSAPIVSTIETDAQDIGPSPRRLNVEQVIDSGECTSVKVSDDLRDEQYGVMALSATDAEGIVVTAKQNRIEICNGSESSLNFSDRDLLIDTRTKD